LSLIADEHRQHLEDGVLPGHPDLFQTGAEVAVIAAKVITWYAR
jgi:hypothetical protein